jgi:hypothetical protein
MPLPPLDFLKREAIIRQLEWEALDAARSLESPYIRPKVTNPRALAILKLAGEYYRGEKTPSPMVRAIAQRILENARRINNSRS